MLSFTLKFFIHLELNFDVHLRQGFNTFFAAAAAKSLQLCLTLCNPIDSSPPGSPVPGILQARTLEWVAISFSNAWKWKVKVKVLSHVWLLATPWTAAYQAPLSMGFSRHEYWSGVPLPSLNTFSTKSFMTSESWIFYKASHPSSIDYILVADLGWCEQQVQSPVKETDHLAVRETEALAPYLMICISLSLNIRRITIDELEYSYITLINI